MNWKLLVCSLICGIAALSPAPIRDLKDGEHALPKHSAEQVASEQQYNGAVGIVGVVPQKTNPDGTGPEVVFNDSKAASVLANTKLPTAQQSAISNIDRASAQLKLDGMGGPSPFLIGFVVLCFVAAVLYGAKVVLEKVGPAPKTFNPSERLR